MKSHCDALVVGGGIIGLSCAHYLARTGRKIMLIEKDRIGAGASHGNCGLVFTSDLVPLCTPGAVRREIGLMLRAKSELYISPRPHPARLRWLLNFAGRCTAGHVHHAVEARRQILIHSALLYDELFSVDHLEADRECNGVLMVYATEEGWRNYAATNDLLRPYGLDATPVRGKALRELEPALRSDLYGGWYHPNDCHLKPDTLLDSWRRRLVSEGVAIEENRPLKRFVSRSGRVVTALTDGGEIVAENYVLAAGAWSPEILSPLGIPLPIEPGKGYSITMDKPAGAPQIPCYLHEKRTVATPWKSAYRIGGIMELRGLDSAIKPRRIKRLISAARAYLDVPAGAPAQEEWTGMRPMTYDELPVIGHAPALDNLIIATGHGMLGLSTAPSTGRLVAEMIAGQKPHIDPAPFSAGRF